jgi:polyisoprenoid-binding protein YceI
MEIDDIPCSIQRIVAVSKGLQNLARAYHRLTALIFLSAILFSSCGHKKVSLESGDAIVESTHSRIANRTFTLDTAVSTLRWTGSEGLVFNLENAHFGTLPISGGMLMEADSGFYGTFEVSVLGMKVLDIEDEKKNKKLVTHLLSSDFFDAQTYPNALFEIKNATLFEQDSMEMKGNLTIKGVTRSIIFPTKVHITDSMFQANASFYIDRKDWGIHYRTENSLGDEIIRPEIWIELEILAVSNAILP